MQLRNGLAELRVPAAPSSSVYLHPGQMTVTDEEQSVTTILGSCVAVCLWDPVSRVGGMVHFLLPAWDRYSGNKSPRHGDVALPSLLDEMKKRGARISTMRAKVFGGACVLRAFASNGNDHLGAKNVDIARALLREAGIPIVEEDTLGSVSRKVHFNTRTGVTSLHSIRTRDGD